MFTRSEYLVEKYTVALKCSGMSHWYHITTMPTSEFFRTELLQYDNWLTNRDRQTNRQTETKKMDRDRARRQTQRQRQTDRQTEYL